MSPPHARSWLCPHLPIDTHCTHVRAGLLLLRASVPRPRLAAPFPPVLPAARANGTRAALLAEAYGVRSIPSLVLLRADGSLVSTDGLRLLRKLVLQLPKRLRLDGSNGLWR